ncbi:MAG: methylated-DNA--[protein]-cysteine S-methyltransferase [Planctomycetia bacterium]|nr:methylated-DNA--[protein]-cysteine S-methyltransferase [Planctomycetia bacterium]
MSTTYFHEFPSPIGSLLLVSNDDSLTGLYMTDHSGGPERQSAWQRDESRFAEVCEQLAAYFAGNLRNFDVPVEPAGTEFQLKVWNELRQIPYGETISYGELARRIDQPAASRAVGRANGQNPISIIIPCHRVIGSNGTLTGYGGGLDRKRWLLDHEGAVPESHKVHPDAASRIRKETVQTLAFDAE